MVASTGSRVALSFLLVSLLAQAGAPSVPVVQINDGSYWRDFDAGWCAEALIPVQDPIFPTIRRDAFEYDTNGIAVIPGSWYNESATRVPQLRSAAAARLPMLMGAVVDLVGRPFSDTEFTYFFYLCPYFMGATASARVFSLFQYLSSAVGALQWPDWLFTDEYLFHEALHQHS